MTRGAKCRATGTIDFVTQGPADGALSGLFNGKGTLTLVFDNEKSSVSVTKLASEFEVNRAEAVGQILWDQTDALALDMTCDDLSLRIEGRVRYVVARPFEERGVADVRIIASRRGITGPYYGKVMTTFAAAR